MNESTQDVVWRFAGAELDQRVRELRIAGAPVDIEPRAFDLLVLLLDRAGEVVTTGEFLQEVWQGRVVAETAVQNIVSKLRRILGDDRQEIIKTIPKVGYRLMAPVERLLARRGPAPELSLNRGDPVPGREQWRLTERLEGGYGDVWVGEHRETHEKRVFKFCLEAERLSALKREVTLHRLLRDALGERDDYVQILEWNFENAPYFIESAYAGLDLKRWMDGRGGAHTLPLRERIDLVARIGDALAAAHSVGVLHKDLKPQNILVAQRGGSLQVRLGDFGAGRLLDAGKLGEFGITRLGFTKTIDIGNSTSGTLPYMAPELLGGAPPSVQSDVYSIGVLLYQLVAGDLDKLLAPGWEADVPDEFLVEDIRDATNGNRERRLPSVQLLVERLKGLGERRAQRDRQRQEQLQARQAIEALNRSRARRPWLIAAAVVLLAGIAVSSYFFRRAQVEARLAQEQAELAQAQAHRAEALNDFLTHDILDGASPSHGGSPKISLIDAIERSVPRIQKRFAANPELEIGVDRTVGDLLADPYDSKAGLEAYRREVELETRLYGSDDARTLDGQIHLANALRVVGQVDEGEALFNRVYPLLKSRLPPDDRRVLNARSVEFDIMLKHGDYVPALDFIRTLRDDSRRYHPGDELTESFEEDYLRLLQSDRRWAEIEHEARSLYAVRLAKYGPDDFRTLDVRTYIGSALAGQEKFDEAEQELKASLDAMIKSVGPDVTQTVSIYHHLAGLYEARHQWLEAAKYNKAAHEARQRVSGDLNLFAIQDETEYANDLCFGGKAADALAPAQEAYDNATKAFSSQPGNWVYTNSRIYLAQIFISLGQPEKARPLVDEVKTIIATKAYEENWQYHAMLRFLYAQIAYQEGDVKTARSLADQALALFHKAQDEDDAHFVESFQKAVAAGGRWSGPGAT